MSKISDDEKESMINGRSDIYHYNMMQKITNMILRFTQAAMLELIICMLINTMTENESPSDFESISKIISIFVGVLVLLYLGLMFILATVDANPERDPDSLPPVDMYTLYQGMNNRRRNAANAYLIATTLRSAVYALIVIQMDSNPGFQI